MFDLWADRVTVYSSVLVSDSRRRRRRRKSTAAHRSTEVMVYVASVVSHITDTTR